MRGIDVLLAVLGSDCDEASTQRQGSIRLIDSRGVVVARRALHLGPFFGNQHSSSVETKLSHDLSPYITIITENVLPMLLQ